MSFVGSAKIFWKTVEQRFGADGDDGVGQIRVATAPLGDEFDGCGFVQIRKVVVIKGSQRVSKIHVLDVILAVFSRFLAFGGVVLAVVGLFGPDLIIDFGDGGMAILGKSKDAQFTMDVLFRR